MARKNQVFRKGRPSIASLPITKPQGGRKLLYLSQCSQTCLQDKIKVPAHFLRFPNGDGKVQECTTSYFEWGPGNEQPTEDGINGDVGQGSRTGRERRRR